MHGEIRSYIQDCVESKSSVCQQKLRDLMEAEVKSRVSELEARQRHIISDIIKEKMNEIETLRHRRIQLYSSIGGFSLVTLAVLTWGNITSIVSDRADEAIEPKLEEIVTLRAEYEEIQREVKTLSDRVDDKLGEVEVEIRESRAATDAVETAKGGMAIMRDLIEMRLKINDLEEAADRSSKMTDMSAGSSGVTAKDCIDEAGNLNLDCAPGD